MASSVTLSGAAALAAGSSAASAPLASACFCRETTKRPYGTISSPSVLLLYIWRNQRLSDSIVAEAAGPNAPAHRSCLFARAKVQTCT